MDINLTQDNNAVTVALRGRLDTVTSPALEKVLEPVLPEATSIVLDFSNLEYISSAGLRVILAVFKTLSAQDKSMVIKHANESVFDVFRITDFDSLLTFED